MTMRASLRETLYIFLNLEESGPQKKRKDFGEKTPSNSIFNWISKYVDISIPDFSLAKDGEQG
jgi:hypothetical protein